MANDAPVIDSRLSRISRWRSARKRWARMCCCKAGITAWNWAYAGDTVIPGGTAWFNNRRATWSTIWSRV